MRESVVLSLGIQVSPKTDSKTRPEIRLGSRRCRNPKLFSNQFWRLERLEASWRVKTEAIVLSLKTLQVLDIR